MSGTVVPPDMIPYNMQAIGESFGIGLMFVFLFIQLLKVCDWVLLSAYAFYVIENFQKQVSMIPPPEMPTYYFVSLANSMTSRPIVLLTLYLLTFLFIPLAWVRRLMFVASAVLFLDLLWFVGPHEFGLMSVTSFDTAIAALILPWLLLSRRVFKNKDLEDETLVNCYTFLTLFFTVLLICLTGRTGIVVGGVMCLAFSFYQMSWKIFLADLLIMAFTITFWGAKFFEPNGRVAAYKAHFRWWKDSVDPILGVGMGGVQFVAPWIPVNGVRYNIMHNEFLQVLFETGVIGLIVFLIVVGWIFYKAYRHSVSSFVFVCGFLVVMMTYFPLHFFISNFLLLLYLKTIFYGRKEGEFKCL